MATVLPDTPETAAPAKHDARLLRLLLQLALIAWVVRSLIIAPFSIPSGSMLPTLFIGDYLMVAKWPYGYSRFSFPFEFPPISGRIFAQLPHRGDVVVFRPPGGDSEFIKRVIGLPGDTVTVRRGTLVLNGTPVARQVLRPFAVPVSVNSPCKVVAPAVRRMARTRDGIVCLYPAYREALPGGPSYTVLDQVANPRADDFPVTTVPAGFVFMMGDNRDDSLDSRFSPVEGGVGFVPLENLVGRALITFWSTDGGASYVEPWTWITALRGSRIGNGYAE
jgi:signal peptidase I